MTDLPVMMMRETARVASSAMTMTAQVGNFIFLLTLLVGREPVGYATKACETVEAVSPCKPARADNIDLT